MPVKSYIAHAAPGSAHQLAQSIAALPGCSVVPAENRDAVVVITDSPSEEAETELRSHLEQLETLISLTLVSAFSADDDLISIAKGSTPQ
jgi:nitrate reductase NapAB chaperone NapD